MTDDNGMTHDGTPEPEVFDPYSAILHEFDNRLEEQTNWGRTQLRTLLLQIMVKVAEQERRHMLRQRQRERG